MKDVGGAKDFKKEIKASEPPKETELDLRRKKEAAKKAKKEEQAEKERVREAIE